MSMMTGLMYDDNLGDLHEVEVEDDEYDDQPSCDANLGEQPR